MADLSKRGGGPWLAFLAGAVAMLAVMLVVFGWQGGARLADGLAVSLRDVPDLPRLPHLPEAPRLPDTPTPKPQ